MDQTLRYSTRWLLQHWTESSIIPASRKMSVWRNRKLKKKTASSEENRSLTWSRSTSGSLEPMILSRIMPTYVQLFFEMTIFQEFGPKWDEFLMIYDANPIWWNLGKLVQFENTTVWETQDRIGIVQHGDSSEESQTWLSQIEDNGKNKYRAEFANEEFWGQKRKLWDKRRGQSRIRGTKQREQRSLGDCWQWKANGQCSKGDNCSFRHDLNKRAKSTQPNPSPRSSAKQNVKKKKKCIENQKSWRQKPKRENGSTAVQGFWKEWWQKCSGYAENLHATLFACFKIRSRRSLQRFCGRAQTYWKQSDVFDSIKPWYIMLTFETRIHRLEWFAMLQNLRIGFRKRQSGKSDVPVKQRGSWPKIFLR